MKRFIKFTVVISLFIFSVGYAFASEVGVSVSIGGESVVFTEDSGSPFIDENNRTQVPFRQTLEAFGANVEWEASSRTAIAEKNDVTVRVPIGASHIYRNGVRIMNDTYSLIRDGRTYLPIRVVIEAFGANVEWDAATRTVMINANNYIIIRGVRHSTSLTALNLSGQGLNDEDIIPLRYMTNLTDLRLIGNEISDISPLADLTNLTGLFLGANNISDLTPLANLTNLTGLLLDMNQINDLAPLAGLTNLTELSLGMNQISDLTPLGNLAELEWLNLMLNPIRDWSPVQHVPIVEGRL